MGLHAVGLKLNQRAAVNDQTLIDRHSAIGADREGADVVVVCTGRPGEAGSVSDADAQAGRPGRLLTFGESPLAILRRLRDLDDGTLAYS